MQQFLPNISKHCSNANQMKRYNMWGAFLAAAVGTAGAFSHQHRRKQVPISLKTVNLHRNNHYIPNASDFRKPVQNDLFAVMKSILMQNTALCASVEIEEDGDIDTELPLDDPSSYYYEKMTQPSRNQAESHAIFGTLKGPGYIERYDVYKRVAVTDSSSEHSDKNEENNNITDNGRTGKKEVIVADVKIGKNLNGHPGIVHGGIISLLMDDSLGWGCEAMDLRNGMKYGDDDCPIVVTANLSVDFRAPLPATSSVVIRVYHDRTEGRKVYASARMESYDGSVLYSEASVLFIIIPMSRLKQQE